MFVIGKDFKVEIVDGRTCRFVVQKPGDKFVAPTSRRADLVRVEPRWTSNVIDALRDENLVQATR